MRTFLMGLILLLILPSASNAGFYSSQYSRETGTIVASVQIKDKGIYNLIVSAKFLRRPQDKKIYKTDEYERFLDRLEVEWRGVALQKILESKELSVTELVNLKNSIQEEIVKLIERLKEKLVPDQNVEVVFSLSDFFLLEPREK